jgi:hypothetical protein
VATESGKVEMTAGHPVWVLEGEGLEARPPVEHLLPHEHEGRRLPCRLVLADDARVGDRVMLRLNGPATVTGLTVRPPAGPVVNLKVKDLRTFCVGFVDLLVHNANEKLEKLIEKLMKLGSNKHNLVAKLFGGANRTPLLRYHLRTLRVFCDFNILSPKKCARICRRRSAPSSR